MHSHSVTKTISCLSYVFFVTSCVYIYVFPKYVHFKGLKLSSALGWFSFTLRFLCLKMRKSIFSDENKSLERSFCRIEVQVITNPSSRLEKNTKHLSFCLCHIFYELKNKQTHFPTKNSLFKNHQQHILIVLYVFYYM